MVGFEVRGSKLFGWGGGSGLEFDIWGIWAEPRDSRVPSAEGLEAPRFFCF